jgi:hypothetical protein
VSVIPSISKFKMYKNPAVVLIVFLQPMIELLDVRLHEESYDTFLQLSAALAGDYLDECDPIVDSLGDDAVQFRVDSEAFVIDIV